MCNRFNGFHNLSEGRRDGEVISLAEDFIARKGKTSVAMGLTNGWLMQKPSQSGKGRT